MDLGSEAVHSVSGEKAHEGLMPVSPVPAVVSSVARGTSLIVLGKSDVISEGLCSSVSFSANCASNLYYKDWKSYLP